MAEHLITHNAKAPKEAKWVAPRYEEKAPTKKAASPPSSASYDYATKKSARKSTVPRRSIAGGSPAVSESGAAGDGHASAPPSPTPPSTSEAVAAGVPSARSATEEGAVGAAVGGGSGGVSEAWGSPRRLGGSQGHANHKRAARVPAGPPQGVAPPPQLVSAMGTARRNDPKTYKSVPHEWTCMIVVSYNEKAVLSVSVCLTPLLFASLYLVYFMLLVFPLITHLA